MVAAHKMMRMVTIEYTNHGSNGVDGFDGCVGVLLSGELSTGLMGVMGLWGLAFDFRFM